MEIEKILVIFWSGIGNIILFMPTLRAIRKGFPNAEITLLLKDKGSKDIIKDSRFYNNIVFYQNSRRKWKRLFLQLRLIYNLRKYKYDLIITTFESQGYKMACMAYGISGKCRMGFRTDKWYDRLYSNLLEYHPKQHEIDRHLTIAHSLGIKFIKKDLEIFISKEEERFAEITLEENGLSEQNIIIGIHPGSSDNLLKKRWLPERFAQVADYLSEKYGANIIIFGGSNEIYLAQKVVSFMKVSIPIILVGKTTIRQTAAVIERCNLFISNDSGLMHVSAAVKIPVVAIFGPTGPIKNAPLGEGHIIVRKDIPCSPCSNYQKNGCDNVECIKLVTVEDVLIAVENKLISLGLLTSERKRAL